MKEAASPLVSIIIPTYNQAAYIRQAISGALAQDYQNLEVLVADDCSTDDTENIVKGCKDSRLRYLRNEVNLGRVGNYRKALYEHARGIFVLNLDGDDLLFDRSYISAAVAAMTAEERPVFAFADRYERDDPFEPPEYTEAAGSIAPEFIDGTDYVLSLPKPAARIHHLAVLYDRSAAMAIDFYRRDIISSDYESLWRLALGNTIAHIPCRVAVWRRHAQNASRGIKIQADIDNFALFDGVHDHAVSVLGEERRASFGRWMTMNVANRYYGKILAYLRSGSFKELAEMSAVVRKKYPRAYRRAVLSPKTIVKGAAALLMYAVSRRGTI